MKRVLYILLSAVLVLSMPMQAFAAPSMSSSSSSSASGSNITDGTNSLFYRVASAASIYTDVMSAWNPKSLQDELNAANSMANVSSGLGYIDPDHALPSLNYTLSSKDSQNVTRYSISNEAFSRIPGAKEYAEFGYAAQFKGLDSTTTSNSTGMLRGVIGALTQGMYWLASSIGKLMQQIANILSFFNPFNAISAPLKQIVDSKYHDVGKISNATSSESFFVQGNPIADMFSTVMSPFLGTTTSVGLIALYMAVTIVGILLVASRKGASAADSGRKVKTLAVRILFMTSGILLLGYMYTSLLNWATSEPIQGKNAISKSVLTTFVDTESWAKNNFDTGNLANGSDANVTDGANYSDTSGSIDISRLGDVSPRVMALNINGVQSDDIGRTELGASYLDVNSYGLTDLSDEALKSMPKQERQDYLKYVGSLKGMDDKASTLLGSYTSGKVFTSADYQNYVSGLATKDTSTSEKLNKWASIARDPVNYAKSIATAGVSTGGTNGNAATTTVPESNLFLQAKGDYKVEGAANRSNDVMTAIFSYVKEHLQDNDFNTKIEEMMKSSQGGGNTDTDLNYLADGRVTGDHISRLSTVGTYNYLSSVFDSSGFNVYSADESQNNFTRYSHYSVSAVGAGPFGQILSIVNLIALLAAYGLIGLVYSLGLLFSNIRRGLTMLIHLPFAALGALRSIGQVIMLVSMMCFELVVSLVLYHVAIAFVEGVNRFILDELPGYLNVVGGSNSVVNSVLFGVIGTAALIGSIILALRLRGMVIAGMSDVASRFLEAFILDQKPAGAKLEDKQSTALASGAKGLATGLAMAGANGGAGGIAKGAAGLAVAGAVGSALAAGGDAAGAAAGAAQLGANASSDATGMGQGMGQGVGEGTGMANAMGQGMGSAQGFGEGSAMGKASADGASALAGADSALSSRNEASDIGSASSLADAVHGISGDAHGQGDASAEGGASMARAMADTGDTSSAPTLQAMSAQDANLSVDGRGENDMYGGEGFASAESSSDTGLEAALESRGVTGDSNAAGDASSEGRGEMGVNTQASADVDADTSLSALGVCEGSSASSTGASSSSRSLDGTSAAGTAGREGAASLNRGMVGGSSRSGSSTTPSGERVHGIRGTSRLGNESDSMAAAAPADGTGAGTENTRNRLDGTNVSGSGSLGAAARSAGGSSGSSRSRSTSATAPKGVVPMSRPSAADRRAAALDAARKARESEVDA
jgi:hypothetical protein